MTRLELLKRLQEMQKAGSDMNLPLVVRVSRKVEDKRRTCGYRIEQLFSSIEGAYHDALCFDDRHGKAVCDYGRKVERKDQDAYYQVAELHGKVLTEFTT